MAKKDVERLIGRALLDPKFRERLFADPEKAVRKAGLNLTDEEMAALAKIDPQKAKSAIEAVDDLAGQPWA